MTLVSWLILIIGGALAFGFAYLTYFRREPAGRGRGLLLALRAAALLLIVVLLIDPRLGATARSRADRTRVVLDASLSMRPRAADSTGWQQALSTATRMARAGVIVAGEAPRSVGPDSLRLLAPSSASSRMLPAIQAAAEAGAQRVVVVTDGAIEDTQEIASWLPRLGVELDVERVQTPSPANRAVAEVDAPAWAEAGQPLEVRVAVAARGAQPDQNAALVVRQGGTVVARSNVALPGDTRLASVALTFTASGPPEGGLVRYDVAFETADSIPDDDVRTAYVFVSEEPAGVALVSFLPDWEPRFLHPVLAQALGLPVRTFLRVPNGGYFRAAEGLQAGTRVEEAIVRRAVAQADVLVLHGVSESAPEWWREAAQRARRLILLPAGPLGEPYQIGGPVVADWYIAPEIPSSPIAPFLQDLNVSEVPPLESLFNTAAGANAWAPLNAGRTRRGGRAPALLAQETAGRRVAVATGTGYWRWAFRGGAARDLYTRLWGAVAGWIAQEQAQVAGAGVRPVTRVVQRGSAPRWIAPGMTVDSLQIRLTGAGGLQQTMTVRPQRGDTALSAVLPPGHYQYDARAFAAGEVVQGSGALTVESYSAEFMRAPADLSELRSAPTALLDDPRSGGRPLHASPWPYVLIVLLLCTEWVFRRRWGLR